MDRLPFQGDIKVVDTYKVGGNGGWDCPIEDIHPRSSTLPHSFVVLVVGK
jgi:hypothetical protein